MKNVLPVAIVMGAIVGLFVGGFLNVFNVPVMEWAISLEETAAAAEAPAGAADEGGIVITLGQQRIGLVAGLAVLGVLFGAVFTGLYHLIRLASPGWNIWAWASIAAALGFLSVSLLTQVKYPLNPPGIGEGSSLLARQGFQFLFAAVSLLVVVGGTLVVKAIHQSGSEGLQRFLSYAGVSVAYGVVMVVAFLLIPGNPDPIPEWVPASLVIMFRTFTVVSHFVLWMGIGFGVAGYISYNHRGIKAYDSSQATPVGGRT
jgi:hypothetical protein